MDSNLHGFWLPNTGFDLDKKTKLSQSIYLLRVLIPNGRKNITCWSLRFLCFWILLSGKRLYKLSSIQLFGKSIACYRHVDLLRPYRTKNNLWIKWKRKESYRNLHHSYLRFNSHFHFSFLNDRLDWSQLCKSWSAANKQRANSW